MEADYIHAYPELYRRHWWWQVRKQIVTREIRRILQGREKPLRILDVGCGAGLFFDVLERFGEIEGIESDREAVESSGRWRSRITLGELDETYRPTQPFDLILMLDVLEHVPAPDHLLRRAVEILRPGGWVLITVPAFQWLWTTHDDLNHHLRRYSAGQIRTVVSQAGLVPVKTRYVFQSLVAAKLAVRARESLTSACPSVPTLPPRVVNAALKYWCRTEHLVAGWLPFGTSVMLIATQRARPRGA